MLFFLNCLVSLFVLVIAVVSVIIALGHAKELGLMLVGKFIGKPLKGRKDDARSVLPDVQEVSDQFQPRRAESVSAVLQRVDSAGGDRIAGFGPIER